MPLNAAFGWIWILASFLAGLLLGLRFREDDWLGGYGSFRRRLLRLGHVSLAGLGILNVLFALGAERLHLGPAALALASRAFIAGGLTMPLCCGLAAFRPRLQPLFAVPVVSLVLGASLVVAGMLRP